MKNKTQKISRREMLAGMAVSSLAGVAKRSAFNRPGTASDFFHSTGSRIVRLEAKPDPIAIDTAKTAVIVVDMQNDFGTKCGMFDRAGVDVSIIEKAVGPTATALAAARNAGIKIIYLKMGYHPDLSDLGAPDSVNRVRHLQRMHVGT